MVTIYPLGAPIPLRIVRTYAPFERGWLLNTQLEVLQDIRGVRTYAPFERGWLPRSTISSPSDMFGSGLTPRLRGDGYQ